MRYGFSVAAAMCLLAGAGQAQAARYVEFEVQGQTALTGLYDVTGRPENPEIAFLDVLVSFDTSTPESVGGYVASGSGYAAVYGTSGYLLTLNEPGGPAFNLTFNPAAIATGESLSPVAASGSVGYVLCSRACVPYPGMLLAFTARTSDIAPASIGITDRTTIASYGLPEPASWATMVLGMGALGWTIRRRRDATGSNRLASTDHPSRASAFSR